MRHSYKIDRTYFGISDRHMIDLLKLNGTGVISLIGAGGKTSIMFHLAKALASKDPTKTQPLEALKIRRDLLVRYPQKSLTDRGGFKRDKKVVELFNKALALEQQKVVVSENDVEAVVDTVNLDLTNDVEA